MRALGLCDSDVVCQNFASFRISPWDFEELAKGIINDDDSAGGKLLWLALGGQLPPFFVCFVMAPWKVFLQLGPFDEQLDRLRVQVELPDVLCLE